jgi:hypothetical protein
MKDMPMTSTIWVLHDQSNSNPNSKNYLWWFETEKLAKEFLQQHNKWRRHTKLVGPFKYVFKPEPSKKSKSRKLDRKLDKADEYLLMRFRLLRDYLDLLEEDIRSRGASYAAWMGGVPIGVLEEASKIWTTLSEMK